MKIALVVIVLAACGSKSKAADEPKPVTATCVQVADRMMAKMGAKFGTTKEIIVERCEVDGWSAAARQCLSTMTTEADADQCAANLTDDQKAALVKDERARRDNDADGAIGGGGGGPGGPSTGAPPPPAPPAPTTRGPKQKDDPCQGGEDDPCQGGQRAPKKKP